MVDMNEYLTIGQLHEISREREKALKAAKNAPKKKAVYIPPTASNWRNEIQRKANQPPAGFKKDTIAEKIQQLHEAGFSKDEIIEKSGSKLHYVNTILKKIKEWT